MTISLVRWKDANYSEATGGQPAKPELSKLCEIGFLLAENEDALVVGIEMSEDDTDPGRWRVTIPKVNVVERYDVKLDKFIAWLKKAKAHKKPKCSNGKNKTTGKLLPGVGVGEQPAKSETCTADTPTSA